MESWKKYCPDYEIIEWNESNFDLDYNIYVKEAYKEEKWAFVSDIARLYAVYVHGGIYLDTDVEIIKPIDNFLNNSMFIGFESDKRINTGLGFGAEKNFHIVKKMLDVYAHISFINPDGTCNTAPCPVYNTLTMEKEGFMINNTMQTINNTTVYPTDYFCPKNCKTGLINITENTHTIHHFDGSWLTAEQRQEYSIITEYRKKYGITLGEIIYSIAAICTFRKVGINNIIEKLRYKTRYVKNE
jgi:mannosyltransferase OCH1-like enzyme